MHSIINNSSKRMIQNMKLLVQREYSINDISNVTGVSLKTVIEDFNKINSYIIDVEDLVLTYEDNTSLIKTNLTFETFFIVQSKILLDSLSIKFLIELIKNPFNDINYYSNLLYTSNSSIYRRLDNLNKHLDKYGLSILNNGSLYYIMSEDEYEYRRFITSLLLEIYGKHISNIIDLEWIIFFNSRLEYTYKKNSVYLTDYFLDYFSVFYFISIFREMKGYTINYSKDFIGKNHPFSLDEIKYLTENKVNLSVDKLYAIESTIYMNNYLLSSLLKSEDIFIIKKHIDILFTYFDMPVLSDEKEYLLTVFSDIFISMKFFKVPFPFLNHKCVFFNDNIKKNHPFFYKKIKEWLHNFEVESQLLFSEYEDYLFYSIVVTVPAILNFYVDFPVVIVSEISEEHALFVKSEIAENFRTQGIYFLDLSYIEKEELNVKKLENGTLLISDFEVNYVNLILINQYPDLETIKKCVLLFPN